MPVSTCIPPVRSHGRPGLVDLAQCAKGEAARRRPPRTTAAIVQTGHHRRQDGRDDGLTVVRVHPTRGPGFGALAAPAAALGLQSIAIQRFGVFGLSTTYLTGTLTTVVIRLVPGHGVRAVRHSALILLGLVVGAAAIAGLLASVPMLAPVLLVGTVGSVLVVVLLRRALVHR